MTKKRILKSVYVNHYAPSLHTMYNDMLNTPPEGYRYILKATKSSPITNQIYSINKLDFFWKFNKNIISKIINTVKVKDFLYPIFVIPKKEIDLIYSTGYIVKKDIPWIIDIEILHVLNGYNLDNLKKNKQRYQKYLELDNCKGITVWNSLVYKSVSTFFDSDIINNKLNILRHAILPNDYNRDFQYKENINLLFLGSGNILTASYIRGIKEALLIYKKLLKKYNNISLTIAPFLPLELEEEFGNLEGLIIKNKVLNKSEMEKLYKEIDILLHPSYSNPAMTLLEAMNFGISIVTTNYGGISDLVIDGYNGFICKNNSLFEYYGEYFMSRKDLEEQIIKYSGKDKKMIDDFVLKTSYLIDNVNIRKKIGVNAKNTILKGEFSFKYNNEKLKIIYDSI